MPALPTPGFPQPSPGHLGPDSSLWGPQSCACKGVQSIPPPGCQWHRPSVTTKTAFRHFQMSPWWKGEGVDIALG